MVQIFKVQEFPFCTYPDLQLSNLYFVPSLEQLSLTLSQVEQLPFAGHNDKV